jgi:hypothetical protein
MKMTTEKLSLAETILSKKLEEVQKERTSVPDIIRNYPDFLSNIFRGNHKTYKYILFTALLAKTAFQDDIDPLSIQEGDSSRYGSFDARSLAHKVVVPFERKYLNNALGGSNEPYLNKPARFPTISKNNAVRAGQDKVKLDSLVDNLGNLSTEQATEWLIDSLNLLLDIAEENNMKFTTNLKLDNNLLSMKNLFLDLTKENFGGEMLALSIGGLLSSLLATTFSIEVHKVNQSGASSKEVGDIDIFLDNQLVYSFEAKSKAFALQDVQHAMDKARSYGLQAFYFIYNHTTVTPEILTEVQNHADSNGMIISIMSFENFLPVMLGLCDINSFDILPDTLLEIASEMQISDTSLDYLKQILKKYSQ